MKRIIAILPDFISIGFNSFSLKTEEEQFWNWFIKNQEKLYSDEIRSDLKTKLNKELSNRLKRFGSSIKGILKVKNTNGIKELIISAQGVEEFFPKIARLVNNSPTLNNWKFTALIQRTSIELLIKFRYPQATHQAVLVNKNIKCRPLDIVFGFEDIRFTYTEVSNRLNLDVFIPSYNGDEHKYRIKRLLDDLLGEYDFAIEIGVINCISLKEGDEAMGYPIGHLRTVVDQRKLERKKRDYPPVINMVNTHPLHKECKSFL